MQTLNDWLKKVQRDNPGAVIEPAKPKKKHKTAAGQQIGTEKGYSPK